MRNDKQQSTFQVNKESGMAVFTGPKGSIILAFDVKKGWEQVYFTEDPEEAKKFLGEDA